MALNCYSVNWTIRATNVLTLAKLAAIVVLIGCGIYQMSSGQTQYLARGFEDTTTDSGSIAMAFYAGLWSYYGWYPSKISIQSNYFNVDDRNALNYITEEMINPAVNLPRAIILGLVLVTCCYLAVNVAYLSVLDPETFINSNAVAVVIRFVCPISKFSNNKNECDCVTECYLGSCQHFTGSVRLRDSFSGCLVDIRRSFVQRFRYQSVCKKRIQMLTIEITLNELFRLCFASAREGHMIDFLSYVQVESRTPFPALLFTVRLIDLI